MNTCTNIQAHMHTALKDMYGSHNHFKSLLKFYISFQMSVKIDTCSNQTHDWLFTLKTEICEEKNISQVTFNASYS